MWRRPLSDWWECLHSGAAVQAIRQFGEEREEQYLIQDKRLPELGMYQHLIIIIVTRLPSMLQLPSSRVLLVHGCQAKYLTT